MIMTLRETPMPMPAFAPEERVSATIGNGLCEGRELDVGSVVWAVLVSDCTLDKVRAEVGKEGGNEGTKEEDDGDSRRDSPVLVLDRDRYTVAILAEDTYVDTGFPALGN